MHCASVKFEHQFFTKLEQLNKSVFTISNKKNKPRELLVIKYFNNMKLLW